jgi:short-subunit dehydrogenase
MAESLSGELAMHNIGVSVLCPGPVATGIIARTKQLQTTSLPAANIHNDAATLEKHKRATNWLERGVSPDAVGDMVRTAIRENQLYIHTDRYMEPFVKARTKAILDAMPPDIAIDKS